jgi:hypothetical protein
MENQDVKKRFITAAVLLLVVLVVGGYFVFGGSKISSIINNVATNNKVAATASVATVNGTAIPKAAYDAQLASAIASYKSQGVDVTADATKFSQIKTQVLDDLVNNELLTQGAQSAGIKIALAEVEKQFQTILTQAGGAEGLKTALAQNNLTEAQLRENISKQLTIQAYLLANIDTKSITVSDAEIAQFYTDYSKAQITASSTVKVPALKDLSDPIKQQIISNKQQTLINDFITSLRAKAKIETNI